MSREVCGLRGRATLRESMLHSFDGFGERSLKSSPIWAEPLPQHGVQARDRIFQSCIASARCGALRPVRLLATLSPCQKLRRRRPKKGQRAERAEQRGAEPESAGARWSGARCSAALSSLRGCSGRGPGALRPQHLSNARAPRPAPPNSRMKGKRMPHACLCLCERDRERESGEEEREREKSYVRSSPPICPPVRHGTGGLEGRGG